MTYDIETLGWPKTGRQVKEDGNTVNIADLSVDMAELTESTVGQNKVYYITDTSTYTGNWKIIEVLTETVFNSLLQSNAYVNGVATADVAATLGTVAAGTILYGKFTSIDLTSGSVRAYS